jgi:hypothetical protein
VNIFYLHADPRVAARYHNDKHVVKMILESAQMLSTAHRELDDDVDDILYRSTHKNHPSTKWARENITNYMWLYFLFEALCDEYTHRYGKVHLTDQKLRDVLQHSPKNISPDSSFTQPPQCMPEGYKIEGNSIEAYRNYYMGEKSGFAKWTKRRTPLWWNMYD